MDDPQMNSLTEEQYFVLHVMEKISNHQLRVTGVYSPDITRAALERWTWYADICGDKLRHILIRLEEKGLVKITHAAHPHGGKINYYKLTYVPDR